MSTIAIDISSGSMIEAAVVGNSSSSVQVSCAALNAGTFTDEAQFKQDLKKTFEQLKVNPENCRVLISRPGRSLKSKDEQTAQLFFDTFNISGYFHVTDACLALYGSNMGMTAVVVMYSEEKITIVPCYTGCILPHAVFSRDTTIDVEELGSTIHDAIMSCDIDMRGDFYSNVCLFGDHVPTSDSYVPDLKGVLSRYVPSIYLDDLVVNRPDNSEHLVLQGALLLAGDSSMDTLWFTKAEYQANGAAFVHRKCL